MSAENPQVDVKSPEDKPRNQEQRRGRVPLSVIIDIGLPSGKAIGHFSSPEYASLEARLQRIADQIGQK